jgi:hypothetical protein
MALKTLFMIEPGDEGNILQWVRGECCQFLARQDQHPSLPSAELYRFLVPAQSLGLRQKPLLLRVQTPTRCLNLVSSHLSPGKTRIQELIAAHYIFEHPMLLVPQSLLYILHPRLPFNIGRPNRPHFLPPYRPSWRSSPLGKTVRDRHGVALQLSMPLLALLHPRCLNLPMCSALIIQLPTPLQLL